MKLSATANLPNTLVSMVVQKVTSFLLIFQLGIFSVTWTETSLREDVVSWAGAGRITCRILLVLIMIV